MKKYRAFIYHNGNSFQELCALNEYYTKLGFDIVGTMYDSTNDSLSLKAEKAIFNYAINNSFDVLIVLRREIISTKFDNVASFVSTLECMGISCLSVIDGLLIRQVNAMRDFKYGKRY